VRLLISLLTYPFLRELGLALLHFLWEGASVALLLAAVLALLRGKDARLRYAAACSALALMLLAPALTVWRMSAARLGFEVDEMSMRAGPAERSGKAADMSVAVKDTAVSAPATPASPAHTRSPLASEMEGLLPWLSLVWLAGISLLSARMLGGLILTRRLTRHETKPVAEFWQRKLKEISRQLRVTKPVRLLESTLVQVPAAIGWLRPVILLPAATLAGLTAEQLEAVLAHELAHIRRHDYLINLLQSVAETLLFYHPAVWWVSRQIRLEREHVCDDLAVGVCADAVTYARALTKIERLRAKEPRLAVAATGGELRRRILRLVEAEPNPHRPKSLGLALCFVAALFTTAICTRAVLPQREQVKAEQAARRQPLTAQYGPQGAANNLTNAALSALPFEAASLIAGDNAEGEDASVRRVAIDALAGHAGSVIVMSPRTGRVYAVVNQEWAIRRAWSPASTMKLVTALAGIGEKSFDPSEKTRVSNGAERLDLTDALAVSNNEYFKSLGARVGADHLIAYARRVGLGEQTGINYEGEALGRLPGLSSGINAGRLGAYGEGVEVTPAQLATLVSAIANGGTLLVPRVPRTPQDAAQFVPEPRRRLQVAQPVLEQLIPGMLAAVERGSGRAAKDPSLKIAGKTGTISNGEASTGMFASYAPADDPQLVVVVLLKGKDESGAVAAQVAGSIYKGLNGRW
jgi:beta-lactamase regulating signal transducer with metallopeptidase domain/beta-lactamase class D